MKEKKETQKAMVNEWKANVQVEAKLKVQETERKRDRRKGRRWPRAIVDSRKRHFINQSLDGVEYIYGKYRDAIGYPIGFVIRDVSLSESLARAIAIFVPKANERPRSRPDIESTLFPHGTRRDNHTLVPAMSIHMYIHYIYRYIHTRLLNEHMWRLLAW